MSPIGPETLAFLAGIAADNSKAWFEANRALYEAGFVAPAKALVTALGPRLREISPEVQFDARINGSISRINRDIRFSKDKRPYKDHLDLIFWHGEKRSFEGPGFWFRLTPQETMLGVGSFRFEGELLDSYRQAVVHPRSGKALLAVVAGVVAQGPYQIGEKTRKRLPVGFTAPDDRVDYLLHEGLTASITLPAETALSPDFVDVVAGHYRAMWPLAQWILAET